MSYHSKFSERTTPPYEPSVWRTDCISQRPDQREVVLPMVAVSHRPENVRCGCTTAFYRMRQKQHTKERCGISSHRVKNLFRFYNHCLGSCHFVGEKLHTPLANVEPLRSPSGAAGENEPKQFGLFIGEPIKQYFRKGGLTPDRVKNRILYFINITKRGCVPESLFFFRRNNHE